MSGRRLIWFAVAALAMAAIPSTPAARAFSGPHCLGYSATIFGNMHRNVLIGTPHRDVIAALGENDVIRARGGDDLVCGNAGTDAVYGGAGDDVVKGDSGNDQVFGGPGNDDVIGDPGGDRLSGGEGNDALFGADGNDRMEAGGGSDGPLVGGTGDDTIVGGPGTDLASFTGTHRAVTISLALRRAKGDGTDSLRGIEDVAGSPFPDRITGDARANTIEADRGGDAVFGLGGPDRLSGGAGNDTVDGGGGSDVALFDTAEAPVQASLATGDADGQGQDHLRAVESLLGSFFNDLLVGNDRSNLLVGEEGRDTILGRAGNDTLEGGFGDDQLNGGPGDDVCDQSGTGCEGIAHGDPVFVLTLRHPHHGEVLDNARFHRTAGWAFDGLTDLRSVQVALRRVTVKGCQWWNPGQGDLVPRPCNDPLWVPATFDEAHGGWHYGLSTTLPRGHYRATVRGNGSGGPADVAEFRLT